LTHFAAKLRQQNSLADSLSYLCRYVARRGPLAIKRWWHTRTGTAPIHKPSANTCLGVLVNGGVGDHLVAARFLRDLRSATEPFEFDIFSANPAFANWIFASVPGFRGCTYDGAFTHAAPTYDLSLDISGIVKVRGQANPKLGTLLEQHAKKINAFAAEMQLFIGGPERMDGFLAQKLQFQNVTRATSLHFMAGIPYGGDAFPLHLDDACLAKLELTGKRYVTVHNGFEASYVTAGGQATKCYPHFDQVIALLKQKYPDVQFIQIGAKTSVPLPHIDLNLISRTTLSEASALIRHAAAHLDNESGMVHIASCFAVPCCVVFGPTPPDYFTYAQNVNVRPKSCGGCWWITEDWMERCPRGLAQPICTYSQPPAEVAHAMSSLLHTHAKSAGVQG
jgi:hypothetical protein